MSFHLASSQFDCARLYHRAAPSEADNRIAARRTEALVEPILTETLRYESPVQRITRVARRRVEFGGVTIGEGDLVDVIYGAANRDPAVFADPDTFRPGRPATEHVAFGSGIHYCLGASLAKLEASIALNAMLDRYACLELGPEPAVRQRQAFLTLSRVGAWFRSGGVPGG